MVAKYIILAFVIVIIILIVLMVINPNWFFNKNTKKSSKDIDFQRTSKNGDMTINRFSKRDVEPPDIAQPRENNLPDNLLPDPLFNGNLLNRRRPVRPPPPPLTQTNTAQIIVRPTRTIRPQNQAIVEVLVPARHNNIDEFFDMVFNDIVTTINQNEFNFMQHMNQNNINPIIINDGALMELLDAQIMDMLGVHRDNIINTNQTNARTNADTREQAIDNYINIATRQTNDAQNVHDHTVLAGFKLILNRLMEDRFEAGMRLDMSDLKSLDDIKEEIKKKERRYSDNRPNITLQVMAVIDKMKDGEQISALEIDGEPTTDALCLQLVWERSENPLNKKNEHLLKQAIFDNLLDAWETDIFGEKKIVCVTGRATRMLGSLTLLDFDEKNWEVKKFEDFKNEIFNKVKEIIMEQATLATSSSDANMQNAGRTYLAKTAEELRAIDPPSEEAIRELNNNIKQEISDMIAKYVQSLESEFDTKIPSYMKNSVEKEAIASIDMF